MAVIEVLAVTGIFGMISYMGMQISLLGVLYTGKGKISRSGTWLYRNYRVRKKKIEINI